MMKNILSLNVLLLAVFLSSSAESSAPPQCQSVELIEGAKDYNRLVCEGVNLMEDAHYEKAIATFSEASEMRLYEIPNMRLYSRLAIAYFLNGELGKANENLNKAELSLSVLFGIIECVETSTGFELKKNGRWSMKSPFQEEVAHRMCGAAYEYVYEDRTLENVIDDAKLLEFYAKVKVRIVENSNLSGQ